MKVVAVATVLTTALIMCGCIPRQYIRFPESAGVVLDAQTRQPVAQAVVEITAPVAPDGDPRMSASSIAVRTDQNGRFLIRRKTRWWLVPLVPSPTPAAMFGTVTATHGQYQPIALTLVEQDLHNVQIELLPRAISGETGE